MLSLKTIILNQGDFRMSEAYKELLIKQKESMKDKAIGYVMVVLALFCIGASVLFTPLCLIGTVVFGILSYVLYSSRMQVEYEYTYMDKELRIDRICNASKRKSIKVLDLTQMELMAPKGSHHLDPYMRSDGKFYDFSRGYPDTEELKTYMICFSGERYLVSVTDEFLNAMRITLSHKIRL